MKIKQEEKEMSKKGLNQNPHNPVKTSGIFGKDKNLTKVPPHIAEQIKPDSEFYKGGNEKIMLSVISGTSYNDIPMEHIGFNVIAIDTRTGKQIGKFKNVQDSFSSNDMNFNDALDCSNKLKKGWKHSSLTGSIHPQ